MSSHRYLTKTRFKLGMECPTKLFYTGKAKYENLSLDDSFLKALAEGGFQVGALAKCYYPDGVEIETLDYEESLRQTNELLQQDRVTIFEAAIRYQQYFIRIDILVKNGSHLELIEVKAKSYSDESDGTLLTKKNAVQSNWKPYVYDAAFQQHVLSGAFPNCAVSTFLLLANKETRCATDGLNQKFRITKLDNGRTKIDVTTPVTSEDIKNKLLIKVPIDEAIKAVTNDTYSGMSFSAYAAHLSNAYVNDTKIQSPIGKHCKACEFKTSDNTTTNLASGFKECWRNALHWSDEDFAEPNILELWNFRGKDELINQRKIKLTDLAEEDVNPTVDNKAGLSPSQRQWMQVEKVINNDSSIYFDDGSMQAEMKTWQYPLHFIDFETSRTALPFNKGRRPYEGLAFQFSHHTVQRDGSIEHVGQYLHTQQGEFPSFKFVQALKDQLDKDSGTVFRYSAHENSFLKEIARQLEATQEPIPNKQELLNFIATMVGDAGDKNRSTVDMLMLVKRYYYNPLTHGSNSIKDVLPAILNTSAFLKEKYTKPIYGSANGIKSLNFSNWQWIEMQDAVVVNPYKKLPKLFEELPDDVELLSDDESLNDGGAALTAYARMQFSQMSDYERTQLQRALLKYCELDTFAMVMIYEAWCDLTQQNQ